VLRNRNSFSQICFSFTVLLWYLGISVSPVQFSLSDSFVLTNITIPQSYTGHDPINITNDAQLAVIANNGTGTTNDPYIIANWIIDAFSNYGIYITGTTKHFRIENCWIRYSILSGIYVNDVTPRTATISNNTCISNDYHGIYFRYSANSTIVNNICTNNDRIGIFIYHSRSSILANNTCVSNNGLGISLYESISSTVANNICIDNGEDGIGLGESDSSIIANNTCTSNTGPGISLYESIASIVANNTCTSNTKPGISLEYSASSMIANNIC